MEVISYLNLGENLSQNMRVNFVLRLQGPDPLPTQLNPDVQAKTHLVSAGYCLTCWQKDWSHQHWAGRSQPQMPLWGHDFDCFGTHFPDLSVWDWWCLEHPSPYPHIPWVSGCRHDGSPGSWVCVPAVPPGYWPRDICIISQFSKPLELRMETRKDFPFCWGFELSVMNFTKHSKGFAFSQFATLAIFCLISSQKITCCQLNTVCWWPINLWHAFGAGNEFINKL